MSTSNPNVGRRASKPWYREPYVWMVIGGPLSVVVASFITFGLVVGHPDPVLSHPENNRDDDSAVIERLSPDQREALRPAEVARNHVATPSTAQAPTAQ